jgi:hypothetical protein
MTVEVAHRKRVAFHLLLLEAALLAGILGAFALVSLWLSAAASLGMVVVLGAALLMAVLTVEWILVRSRWRHLDSESGGGRGP